MTQGAGAVMTTVDGPLLQFDDGEDRWRVLPAPFDPTGLNPFTAGEVQAVGPDGRGGLWVVQDGGAKGPFFHRYTNRPHQPVFDDVPQPFAGDRIRAMDASADGTVWLAGDGGALGRYDRVTGWTRFEISGWDGGKAVTALAVEPDGTGVAVGEDGRIAEFGPRGTARASSGGPADKTLRAVDVAPDGYALAGGDGGVLLGRPSGGEFRAITAPPGDARITGIALPTADRAWITTNEGDVFAGRRSGDAWNWERELEEDDTPPLRAIAIAPDGRGYAVGDGGTVLERNGEGWRRLDLGVSDDFTAVALPDNGLAALVGGADGVVWTKVDGTFQLARPASNVDGYSAFGGSHVSGLAVVPGEHAGETEAWAALDGPQLPGALLRYASDPVKPPQPLPDAPAPRPGEVSFVAFGKSDCANDDANSCPGPSGTDALSDVISRRIVAAVKDLGEKAGGPVFSVFTGDANDRGGRISELSRPTLLNEWVDMVARPLDDAGIPTLSAIGVRDLSEPRECLHSGSTLCKDTPRATDAGANIFWRQAMAGRVGQDGGPQTFEDRRYRYRPVRDGELPATPDVEVPANPGDPVPTPIPTGGARTHYAVDVIRDGETLVRLAFVDNSLGSLRASDPLQQPPEPRGQLAWLDKVLGSRPKGARAVVVSTSPSYTGRRETVAEAANDGASFEEVVLRHRASAVVSGRVGWNTLYYTLAPGLHCPEPGGAYPEHAPTDGTGCGRTSDLPELKQANLGPAVPFVISSSAGGKLAEDSGEGYWHGYSVIRLDASGDPAKTIVEQRPILDWLVITADDRVLKPGERVTLEGVGREPPAADTPARFHRLATPAITHRYDLVLADPDKPWLPLQEDGRYVAMSERYPDCQVACMDRQSGEVTTGEGADERVYAIGLLSVGARAATYPLVFEPRTPRDTLEPVGRTSALRAVPAAGRPAPATPSPPSNPSPGPAAPSPHLDLPSFPALPQSAPPEARPPAPPAAPPVPKAPSPPPPFGAPTTTSTPPGLSDVPRVSPVPPPAPQAKPAPKVGAEPAEAGKAYATLAAPEDDLLDVAAETVDPREDLLVDIAPAPSMPPGAAITRREPERPDMQMTGLEHDHQPSAWLRNAGYGGGLTIAALVLAGGWLTVRPRRRPAPATATTWHKRR